MVLSQITTTSSNKDSVSTNFEIIYYHVSVYSHDLAVTSNTLNGVYVKF